MLKKIIFTTLSLLIFLAPMNAQKYSELHQKAKKYLSERKKHSQKEELKYLENLVHCGLPTLTDYYCHDYWTVKSQNPKPLPKSKLYNQFTIKKSDSLAMSIARTAAFLVIKNDSIIYEHYYSGFNKDNVLNSFSMSKTIVSLLIGKAIDLGYIKSLDEPVYKYFDWMTHPKDSLLTIRDLLNMASGLNWTEDFLNPFSDIVKAYYGYPFDKLLPSIHVTRKPNQKWHYQCVNYILAAMIIEKVSHMDLGTFVEKYLWTPLGAEHDALIGKDKASGYPRAFCCFYATPRDFAKLGLMVLHNGKWNGQQIIPASYIEQMHEPAKHLKFKLFRHVDFYKLGMWIYPKPKYKAIYFAGVYGQYIFILPEENAVIVHSGQMVNQLDVMRIPPDVPLYLKIGTEILKQYEAKVQK